jgi:iron complex transport system ATP-binding protein
MDEPTSYLDIRHRFELMDVLRKLSDKGVSIIMSLHELDLALEISDKVLLVRDDGTCTFESPKEVIDKEQLKDLFGLSDDMYKKVRRQFLN